MKLSKQITAQLIKIAEICMCHESSSALIKRELGLTDAEMDLLCEEIEIARLEATGMSRGDAQGVYDATRL